VKKREEQLKTHKMNFCASFSLYELQFFEREGMGLYGYFFAILFFQLELAYMISSE